MDGKGKGTPALTIRAFGGVGGSLAPLILVLVTYWMEVSGHLYTPATLPPG
jgi:hypothetical protein